MLSCADTAVRTASDVGSEAACSLDALERVVHFTGAGADACFYAGHPSRAVDQVPAAEGLRYWLNPSLRARPTTATCEIVNLGPPYFGAASSAVLRIAVAPLLGDGRCFPTRCVVSFATSAQRLDGLSLRPVVVAEWEMPPGGTVTRTGDDAHAPGLHATTVPLRVLYHLALLVGSPATAAEVGDARLYLHLRFTGCSDASDTHRIAAVRLRYEQLGAAAAVLPQLLRQRQRQSSAGCATPYDITDSASVGVGGSHALRKEEVVEVDLTISSSGSAGDDDDDDDDAWQACRGGSDVRGVPGSVRLSWLPGTSPANPRSEGGLQGKAPEEEEEELRRPLRSPPQRSATQPRVERSRSADGSGSTSTDGTHDTTLLRVERALRLPPPPPPVSTVTAAAATESSHAVGGPWPPRKVRTLVLAPSLSPSLCSSSSATTSPQSVRSATWGPRTPPDADSQTAARTPTPPRPSRRCSSGARGVAHHWDGSPVAPGSGPHDAHEPTIAAAERSSSRGSSLSPRRRRGERDAVTATSAAVGSRSPDPHPSPPAPRSTGTRSDTAVLWAATSLLGTAPFTLYREQCSRRSTPATSASNSRASSRDRGGGGGGAAAPPIDAAPPCVPTRSSVPPPSRVASSSAPARGEEAEASWVPASSRRRAPLGGLHPNSAGGGSGRRAEMEHGKTVTMPATVSGAGEATSGVRGAWLWPPVAESSAALPLQWRRRDADATGASHVPPQLRPPRSQSALLSPWPALSGSAVPARAGECAPPPPHGTSIFVPRLLLRTRQGLHEASSNSSTTWTQWRAHAAASAKDGGRRHRDGGTAATTSASLPPQSIGLWATAPLPEAGGDIGERPPRRAALDSPEHQQKQEQQQQDRSRPRAEAVSVASTASLSVVPTSWLQHNTVRRQTSSADAETMPSASERATTRLPLHEGSSHAAVTTAAAEDRDDGVSVASTSSAPPPPPPSSPPPRSRVLFHSSASSTSTSASVSPPPSAKSSSRRPGRAAPQLPLQEPRHHHRRGDHVASQESAAPAQVFPVRKHHASRRGVGRRWLCVARLPVPRATATAATVRLRVALEKSEAAAPARVSAMQQRSRAAEVASASCEVAITCGDAVDVWCGLRAFHSGVIHQRKVHRAECCVVVWSNAQLVTAVELESTEAVGALQHLLASTLNHQRTRSPHPAAPRRPT
ncbi:hypothetical protein NESM_000679300 [Novymonas esmeraldas]|uniref:PH-like domain-containing protein n=1 Tax=Novymonas esmeraldas TaxID=1808958 RepID=A0AAW0ET27_9TRYP